MNFRRTRGDRNRWRWRCGSRKKTRRVGSEFMERNSRGTSRFRFSSRKETTDTLPPGLRNQICSLLICIDLLSCSEVTLISSSGKQEILVERWVLPAQDQESEASTSKIVSQFSEPGTPGCSTLLCRGRTGTR